MRPSCDKAMDRRKPPLLSNHQQLTLVISGICHPPMLTRCTEMTNHGDGYGISDSPKAEPRGARGTREEVPQGHSRALPAGPSSNNGRAFVWASGTRLKLAARGLGARWSLVKHDKGGRRKWAGQGAVPTGSVQSFQSQEEPLVRPFLGVQ